MDIRPSHGTHTRRVGDKIIIWHVEDLWRQSSDLPRAQVDPKTIIDLDKDGWFDGTKATPRAILNHMRRILEADVKHPVILHPDGTVMDGAHRVCKAILLGKNLIGVVRFGQAPSPSEIRALSPLPIN